MIYFLAFSVSLFLFPLFMGSHRRKWMVIQLEILTCAYTIRQLLQILMSILLRSDLQKEHVSYRGDCAVWSCSPRTFFHLSLQQDLKKHLDKDSSCDFKYADIWLQRHVLMPLQNEAPTKWGFNLDLWVCLLSINEVLHNNSNHIYWGCCDYVTGYYVSNN